MVLYLFRRAAKSGMPCPRLIAPCSCASRVISRITDSKTAFLTHARLVDRLFKAILPDPAANQFGGTRAVLGFLVQKIAALNPTVEVSHVEWVDRFQKLIDEYNQAA